MTPAVNPLKKPVFTPTPEQLAFYKWVANKPSKKPRKRHAVVRARAGTGKTTTAIGAISHSRARRIIFLAYNADIVKELGSRIRSVNNDASAMTVHGCGRRLVVKEWGDIRVLNGTDRARMLTDRTVPTDFPKGLRNTVSYLHTKAREVNPLIESVEAMVDLMWRFDIHVPEWAQDDWADEDIADHALKAMDLAAQRSLVMAHGMDFADMIYLPIKNKLMADLCDEIYVDETQDLTPSKLMIARGICPNGRIILIGDDRQAIYSWLGADSDGIDRLKAELDAEEFPLTETFRCAKVIVRRANTWVSDLKARDDAPEGIERYIDYENMMIQTAPGDFVLSRTRAMATKTAMRLLREGKKARIAGRDMSKGLLRLVDKLSNRQTMPTAPFLEILKEWRMAQVEKWADTDTPERSQEYMDQADVLIELADAAMTTDDIVTRINTVFADDGTGLDVIMCSTIHKSKGFERNRVFILTDTLQIGRNREEDNLAYIAVTRAKHELVWVRGGK